MSKYLTRIASPSGNYRDSFGLNTAINGDGKFIYVYSYENTGIHVYSKNIYTNEWVPSHFVKADPSIIPSGFLEIKVNNSGNVFAFSDERSFTSYSSPLDLFVYESTKTPVPTELINKLAINSSNGAKIITSTKKLGIIPKKVILYDKNLPNLANYDYIDYSVLKVKEFIDPTMASLNCYKKIGAGVDHFAVLKNNGKVTGWGYDLMDANLFPTQFTNENDNLINVTDLVSIPYANLLIYNSGIYTGLITGFGYSELHISDPKRNLIRASGLSGVPMNTGFIKIAALNG